MLLLNSVKSVNLRELGSAFAAKVFEALPGIISVFSLTCALAMQMRCSSASAVLDASGLWVCFVHLCSVSFLPSICDSSTHCRSLVYSFLTGLVCIMFGSCMFFAEGLGSAISSSQSSSSQSSSSWKTVRHGDSTIAAGTTYSVDPELVDMEVYPMGTSIACRIRHWKEVLAE